MTKTISRKKQGMIAAVAGGALLLGTGATFAVWTDSETISGATITTGTLDLVPNEDAAWTYSGPGIVGGTVDGSFRMVPGHVVTGTNLVTVNLVGTELQAELTTAGGDLPTDAPLTITWTLGDQTVTGANATFTGLDQADSGALSVRIEFTAGHAPQAGMNQVIDLAGLDVRLTQTVPTTPAP